MYAQPRTGHIFFRGPLFVKRGLDEQGKRSIVVGQRSNMG